MAKWQGKYCEVAGSPGATNQCVDLANAYIRDVLGLPIIEWTNAVDFPSKAGPAYEYILNTPTNIPKEGDIVIWKPSPGHIAVFIEGNVDSFRSFDQNFPVGSPCHVQNHTYLNVTGWLRAKVTAPTEDTVLVPKAQFVDFERVKDGWNQVRAKLNVEDSVVVVLAEVDKLIDYEDKVIQMEGKVTEATAKATELEGKLVKAEEAVDKLTAENTTATGKLQTMANTIDDLSRAVSDLKAISKEPLLSGWKKALHDFLIRR